MSNEWYQVHGFEKYRSKTTNSVEVNCFESFASVGNVFLVLIIGMKNIFILIGCMKCIYQETKRISRR